MGRRPRGQRAAALLLWVLLGTAFVLNAYIADRLYSDNRLVSEVSAALGAVLLAAPILGMAVRDLLRGKLHMNELVALAVLASFAQGDYRTAGIVSFFMLAALVIEARTAEGAHASIESLIRLTPTKANKVLEDGTEVQVAATALQQANRIRIRPGQAVPADGTIVTGQTTLNEATITGESLPVDKGPGDEVFAGTQNLTGVLEVDVTHVGKDTTLGRVRDLILAAEKSRLPIMRIIDRYVGYYTPLILMIALLAWLFAHEFGRVISILVVSCPCALVLATPTAMVAALSAAARHGILVKNIADLEAAGRISAFVFDKTGTLTSGELGVSRLAPADGVKPQDLVSVAAGVEKYSNHPVAQAIQALAREAGTTVPEPTHFSEASGQGVRAKVDGRLVVAGRAGWLRENGFDDPRLREAEEDETAGHSMTFVACEGKYLGWIGLQDSVRPEARPALAELREQGIRSISMITGDRAGVAKRVGAEIGCTDICPEALPEDKVAFVNAVRAKGFRVAVVGDGVNDAPALAAGDTGIAMGAAGSDVAIHSASVALMNNDLRRLPFLMRLSRRARAAIYQNLAVGILFIIGGLTLAGLGMLTPVRAAILHNVGSLIVVFNSARLFRAGDELEDSGEEPATR
ncbi:MAG: cation-translocating P-type ATPase [Kiritimatiellae bacterium]|nr:cation-translocating P-type ATPase [Kiritimatiellia bacterium]